MTGPVRRILIPLDFSDGSRAALKCGALFALAVGAELRLLHVIDLPHFAYADFDTVTVSGKTMYDQSVQLAKQRIQDELKHLPAALRENLLVHVRSGAAAQEITAHAKAERCDLIWLATHGRTGWRRLFVGSVAERVVRSAHCPVLTFGGECTPMGMATSGRILVATDTSELSLEGLSYAVRLAASQEPAPHIDLVYVLEDITKLPAVEWEEFPDITPEQFYARGQERALAKLRELVDKHVPDQVNCEVFVQRGDPVAELLKLAEERSAELIITTTHGWTGLHHALVGSVAEKLVRSSEIPVLTVKGEAEAESAE